MSDARLAPPASPPLGVRRRLGEILVEAGRLSTDQLDRALSVQRQTGGRLGEVLLELGYLSPRDLLRALATQFGLEFVDLDDVVADAEIVARVPESLARRHRAVPVADDGERVVVAMANPADVFAIDDLRAVLRRDVRPVMADPGQIADAIDRIAQGDEQVRQLVRLAVSDSAHGDDDAESTSVVRLAPASPDASPVVRLVDLMIARAVQERASDIHIEPTATALRVRFRVDGVLREAMQPPKSLHAAILSRIKVMADIDIAERRLPQDGRLSVVAGELPIDVRVATVPTVHGESAVLRLLRRGTELTRLADLGMLPDAQDRFEQAYRAPWGAVLVAGPTGSGKTTTLYSALRDLNSPTRNIITIEDPVEMRIDGIKQVQVHNKAGLTFANALRNFLRADPDVILVGEVRDVDTATIATEASLTGHLVLSSIHTNDAASTPMRLIEMGVEPFLVTSALRGVLAQRLARRLCDRCKVAEPVDAPTARLLDVPEMMLRPDGTLEAFRAEGCGSCSGTGYRGRFGIQETLLVSEDVAGLVLDRAPAQTIAGQAVREGMVTMRLDGLRKVAMGWTSVEELLRVLR